MGLIANVYRSVSTQLADGSAFMTDCTNCGWSSRFNTVCVMNVDGPFDPSPSCPPVYLELHRVPSIHSVHVISKEHRDGGQWTMMGGNFLHSSDSRFGQAVRDLLNQKAKFGGGYNDFYPGPVPIHDRVE